MKAHKSRSAAVTILIAFCLATGAVSQKPAAGQSGKPAQAPAAKPAASQAAKPAQAEAKPPQTAAAKAPEAAQSKAFFIHEVHASKLTLDCNTCHVPAVEGSVMLKRPGHPQCLTCHQDGFETDINQKICAQCHSSFPPTDATDLIKFPRYAKERAILFEFSHAKHVDPKARVDVKTGFRSDCTHCHKFEKDGVFATFPRHAECAPCHAKGGAAPLLTADSTTQDCRTCHSPEEIENPSFTKERRMIADHVVSGKHVNLKFSHVAHFKVKDQSGLNCITCHYAVPGSKNLADLSLPKMIDCVECHDTSKTIAAEFRMSNCKTCHIDQVSGAAPSSHTRNVKPPFHTDRFRLNHETESKEAGAKCFVCHQNVTPAAGTQAQCTSCHLVMMPISHSARWKDDIHGKYAAINRESCATCHTADTCSRCHNQLPRSHAPLALFKAGAHARPALLDERSCFACHTFQNSCAECHTRGTRVPR